MTIYNSARRMEKERERCSAPSHAIDGCFTYVVDRCAILCCAAIALVQRINITLVSMCVASFCFASASPNWRPLTSVQHTQQRLNQFRAPRAKSKARAGSHAAEISQS